MARQPPRNRVSFDGLGRFARAVDADLRLGSNGPIRRALKQWGEIYLGFLKNRFADFSRGGGNWKALSRNSIREKVRKSRAALQGKKKRSRLEAFEASLATGTASFPILRDTSTMFRALQPGAPGNEFKHVENGVLVGIGGPARHPGGKASIAEIAAFHQRGGRKLPQRRIVVPADSQTLFRMRSKMREALSRMRRGGT